MKRAVSVITALVVILAAVSAFAVEAGSYEWNGYTIEVKETSTSSMFAPAGMTEDEYCVTLSLNFDEALNADDEQKHALYAEAYLADPQGNTYTPGTWLSSDAGHTYLYAIPKSIAIEELSFVPGGGTGSTSGAEAVIPDDLAGTWHGTGTPKGGGPSIDLSATINADGTGDYTFIQSDYTESYPFTISASDNTFSVDIPQDNLLNISKCEGTYTFEDGVLHLDITTTFASGSSYSYTAECTKAAE